MARYVAFFSPALNLATAGSANEQDLYAATGGRHRHHVANVFAMRGIAGSRRGITAAVGIDRL